MNKLIKQPPMLQAKFRNVGEWLATDLACPFCGSQEKILSSQSPNGTGVAMRAGGEHDYCCMECHRKIESKDFEIADLKSKLEDAWHIAHTARMSDRLAQMKQLLESVYWGGGG